MSKEKYIYVVVCLDHGDWSTSRSIAFKTMLEAEVYCKLHTKPGIVEFRYDRIYVGSMKSYMKRKKSG